ncbi:Acetate CoA-transferase YdiF [Polystyrenella longa]|uniref:Acetate CoA-transferase YdiF n=1 Tax=Polystyrenella longa TaxID=2528007 RepID=A0A518CPE5_9PLAN|nr:CoA-transferase [Polystyrenella longa]QDU81092.1 Acetate CoA-transferase YdiF [Polystyrenella longa]
MRRNVVSLEAAAELVLSGQTVVTAGFVGIAFPEAIAISIEQRFLNEGEPRDLTLMYGAGQGDGRTRGINHFGHEGLVKRVIGGHWGLVPRMGELALQNKIEAYNFPQGVLIHLLRDIAAGKPGTITHVGLDTFIDPDQTGGRMNQITSEPLVEKINLVDRDWLFYKAFPIHVALIRGTTADPLGNITMEREAMMGEVLAAAHAAHNSGGKVICQVERLSEERAEARDVVVPCHLVDAVVVSPAEHHHQTFATEFNPAFSGTTHTDKIHHLDPLPLCPRKLIARRAFLEVRKERVINLGIGLPEGIARVAQEEGLEEDLLQTIESGLIGGTPAGGLDFGASYYPLAMIDSASQFDFYDGGGLDAACLGAAEIDARGNVNVSRFGDRLPGVGGFVNISQNARKVLFCGTFTAGGLEVEIGEKSIHIRKEGITRKFRQEVQQISFSSEYALQQNQQVWYLTERAIFELTLKGLRLVEIAPGIDLVRDILARMDFKPIIDDYQIMPEIIFAPGKMNIGCRC